MPPITGINADKTSRRCYAGDMDIALMDDKVGNLIASADGDNTGSVLLPPASRETQADACRRWRNAGIDLQVAAFRDRARADYIADHPGCKKRAAHDYAWERALVEFPPPGVAPSPPVDTEPPAAAQPDPLPVVEAEPPAVAQPPVVASSGSGVDGLGDLPEDWPGLQSNASLAAEIAWVQANRLRVRRGDAVDLSRSLSPAPSYAALSWLETSILYPSKFADVTVKASGDHQDDSEEIRREKIAIAELCTLLSEARATN